MKNLSTQEILELLRTLEHRGVSREEVLKALLSDVEKHKEIGDFLVLRAQEGAPKVRKSSSYSFDIIIYSKKAIAYYDFYERFWSSKGEVVPEVNKWYDFGDEE